jgi:tRNA A37 threonylcarbamoyladenosine synthetase subunit TsaC/SUA5/YrdC
MTSLGTRIDLILDGGPTWGVTGSTILDVTTDPPEILREGIVRRDRLEAFTQGI